MMIITYGRKKKSVVKINVKSLPFRLKSILYLVKGAS